jgi:predicted nucleic acid-binding Zn ribbon protein
MKVLINGARGMKQDCVLTTCSVALSIVNCHGGMETEESGCDDVCQRLMTHESQKKYLSFSIFFFSLFGYLASLDELP